MKIYALFLFLLMALVTVTADADDDVIAACKRNCYEQPHVPVCSYLKGRAETNYNKCEMQCDGAKMIHPGRCEYEDLLHNKIAKK